MNTAAFYYMQINLLCIAVQMILFFNLRMSGDNRSQQVYFSRALLSCVMMNALDVVCNLHDSGILTLPLWLCYGVNMAYLSSNAIMCLFWALYSEHIQCSKVIQSKRAKRCLFLPPLVITAMAISSPETGWLFSLDAAGSYVRGSLFPLFVLPCYGIPIISFVKALILSLQKRCESRKTELRILASFAIYPFIAGVAQFFLPGSPVLAAGTMLASVTVFIFMQNRLISLDPLTGLNNRLQFRTYLTRKLADWKPSNKRKLYLMILDVDDFKSINDAYGHVEGDRTLNRVADAMRLACRETSAFISRIGGDEFVILIVAEDETLPLQISNTINQELEAQSESLRYPIHVCAGIAAYPGGITRQQYLAIADKRLYEAKRKLVRKPIR